MNCPRNELVTAIHTLASHFENALYAFRDDAEALRKAKGDIAHALKVAAKHNRNGPGCAELFARQEPVAHGELHPDRARSAARTALGYAQAFDGKGIDWHSDDPWPHRSELAQALDWISDLGAMVLNLADRVSPPLPEAPAMTWEQAVRSTITDPAVRDRILSVPRDATAEEARAIITALPEAPDTVRVPPGYRLLKDSTEADRSWLGDALHENGRYSCCCCECGRMFIGHKRRVVCRVCSLEKDTP